MRCRNFILIIAGFAFWLASCKKETETITFEPVSDYLPMTVGKYITYRIDSTVFTNIGRTIEIHKYQVKHVVDAQITDNLGRPSYRILRYIRDTAATQAWAPNGTYFITSLADQVEVIEDNLRFIKLHVPLQLNTDWKGNRYLSDDPYASLYTFSNDDGMNDWDYNIDQFDATATIGTQTVKDIYTVKQIDTSDNAPVTNPAIYGYQSRGIDKYAKDLGLVYRDYILWEYQPPAPGVSTSGYYTGFGIKMWMIDHN